MYSITKRFSFSAAHKLDHLADDHPCNHVHGHNYRVEVVLQSARLNNDDMVRDYHDLNEFKRYLDECLDHTYLNEVISRPATAENLAFILFQVARVIAPEVVAVRVSETEATWAEYRL